MVAPPPLPVPTRSRPWLRPLLIAAPLLLGGLSIWQWQRRNAEPPPRQRPVLVETMPVVRGDLPVELAVTGQIRAINSAAVRPQVSGVIRAVLFREGQRVVAGQPLLQLDPAPFEANLQQAIARERQAQARVLQAEAEARRSRVQARTARAKAQRYQQLLREGGVSRDQAEQFFSDADALQAATLSSDSVIASARAELAAARAAVQTARLQRGYTVVRAPLTGRAGSLQLTVGNLVRENEAQPLLRINQLNPIELQFAVPQRLLPEVRARQGELRATIQDRGVRRSGPVVFVDEQIDAGSGTATVQARFDNADEQLVPGQFVRASLRLRTLERVLLVPVTAVQQGQSGPFVYVAEGKRAVVRPIRTGPSQGDRQAVLSGLQPGEPVITVGQFALRPDAPIRVKPRSPQAE